MFMTPRGLKIRIEVPMGFTPIARLCKRDSNTDAFRVLKTVEGLECIPAVAGFVGASVGLLYGSAWWHVAAGLVAGKILGTLLTTFGAFVIPGLVSFATLWSWVSGYGVLAVIGVASAWILKGWEYAAAWIGGLILAHLILDWFVELSRMKYYKNKLGFPFSRSEVNFFNAYRLHADRLGLPWAIEVAEDEIQSGDWQQCLEDYAAKYPEAVARFVRG